MLRVKKQKQCIRHTYRAEEQKSSRAVEQQKIPLIPPLTIETPQFFRE